MTKSGIAAEATQAKLPSSISLPSYNAAGKAINDGGRARCFAQYIRIHARRPPGRQPNRG